MTLGALLLQPAGMGAVAAPGRPAAPVAEPAVQPAAAGEAGVATPAAGAADPPAVILYPALGFPALVDETREMAVVLLAKTDLSTSPATLAGLLSFREWRPPGPPSSTAHTFPAGSVSAVRRQDLPAEIGERDCRVRLLRLKGVAQLARPLLERYRARGYTRLVSFVLKLPNAVQLWRPGATAKRPPMYTLSLQDEDNIVLELIKTLPIPFDGCPTLPADDRGTLGLDGQPIRMLHPFCAMTPEYLGVAHLTDLHLALRWELMKQRLGEAAPAARDLFNNPNERFVEHLRHFRDDPAIAVGVLTGDLIDYNRGWGGNVGQRDLVEHFLYNRNWLHFYDLITKNYYRPLFTVTGNHDWRLNPYAPLVKITGFGNLGLWLPLLAASVVIGAVTGVITGMGTAILADSVVVGIAFFAMSTAFGMILLLGALAVVEQLGGKDPSNAFGTATIPLVGLGFGALMTLLVALIVGLGDRPAGSSSGEKVGSGAGKGTLWGLTMGASTWLLLYIIVGLFVQVDITDVMEYTNLTAEQVKRMLPEKFEYIDMLGKDSNLAAMDEAVAWYNLVINPFSDYAFAFRNTALAFLDWNKGEDMFRGSPPVALDSLSDEQWLLVNRWIESAIQGSSTPDRMAAVLALHAPLFSPRSDLEKKDKGVSPRPIDSGEIDLGTVSARREELIKRLRDLEIRTVLTLSGHTHISDVFRFVSPERVTRVTDADAVANARTGDSVTNRVIFIASTCSNPVGTRADRPAAERKPQYRQVKWTADGRPDSIAMANPWPGSLLTGQP